MLQQLAGIPRKRKIRLGLPCTLHQLPSTGTLEHYQIRTYFLKYKTPPQKNFEKKRRKISRLGREICGPFFFSAASRRWPFSKSALRAISCANLRQRRSAWTFSNPVRSQSPESSCEPRCKKVLYPRTPEVAKMSRRKITGALVPSRLRPF